MWLCAALLVLCTGAALLVLCTGAAVGAEALVPESRHFDDAIPAGVPVHTVLLRCDDTILVHDLQMEVHGSGEDRYRIRVDSVTVGYDTLDNPTRWLGPEGIAVFGAGQPLPVPVPGGIPLAIPVSVVGPQSHGADIRAYMTYTGSPAECIMEAGLHGPQRIGVVVPGDGPLGGIAEILANATLTGTESFNLYLEERRQPWHLEAVVVHDSGMGDGSTLEAVSDLHDNGTLSILGPVTDAALQETRTYIRGSGMVAISCCSAAPSLAGQDGIFRLSPSGDGADALSALLAGDGARHIIVAYQDGHNIDYSGEAGSTYIRYEPGRAGEVVLQMIAEARRLGEVSVVVSGGPAMLDIAREAAAHDSLRHVKWYVLGALAGMEDLARGELSSFSDDTAIAGIRAGVWGDTVPGGLEGHAAHDAAWILGKAMLISQDSDPGTLSDMIPQVARRHAGLMGDTALDKNGDLQYSDYGIWRILGGEWTRIGGYSQLDNTLWYEWWWEEP